MAANKLLNLLTPRSTSIIHHLNIARHTFITHTHLSYIHFVHTFNQQHQIYNILPLFHYHIFFLKLLNMSIQAIQEREAYWDELIVLHRAQEYWVERRQRLRNAEMRRLYLTTKIKTCRQRSTAIETQLIILNADDVNVDEKKIFTLSQERYDIQKGLQDKLNILNNIDASIKACWHEGGQKMRDVWHEDAPPQYEPEMQPQTWFKTSASVREVPRRPASALDHFAADKRKHIVIILLCAPLMLMTFTIHRTSFAF